MVHSKCTTKQAERWRVKPDDEWCDRHNQGRERHRWLAPEFALQWESVCVLNFPLLLPLALDVCALFLSLYHTLYASLFAFKSHGKTEKKTRLLRRHMSVRESARNRDNVDLSFVCKASERMHEKLLGLLSRRSQSKFFTRRPVSARGSSLLSTFFSFRVLYAYM